MGRKVMDGGFRRIKRAAPAPAAPDLTAAALLLVSDFQASHQAPADPADDPLVQQALDVLSRPLDEGSQEAAEQPQESTEENAPEESQEAAQGTPEDENEDTVPAAPAEVARAEEQYDPIAAVLG